MHVLGTLENSLCSSDIAVCLFFSFFRYNCNRYNEDDAKAARDAQEVIVLLLINFRTFGWPYGPLHW